MPDVIARRAPTPRAERTELLAAAPSDLVRDAGERCLEMLGAPTLVVSPETGVVVLQVREPVVGDRFHLGEVVASRAEVELGGELGWCLRLGTDRVAALAGAVCDAAASADPLAADFVESFLDDLRVDAARREAELSADLSPTIVEFEELD